MDVQSTTFSDNVAAQDGGGVFAYSEYLDLQNCTISNNQAQKGGGIYADGVGTHNFLSHLTVSENSSGDGGGIYIAPTSTSYIGNSIFSGNSALVSGDEIYNDGILYLEGRNLLGDAQNSSAEAFTNITLRGKDIIASNDYRNTPVSNILSLLGNYGGKTETYKPVNGSPAINNADQSECSGFDQRGEKRELEGSFFPIITLDGKVTVVELGGGCDIGSFELVQGD